MKKLLSAAIAALFASTLAAVATVPNIATPTDPSQIVAIMNGLVQSLNTFVTPTTMGNPNNFRNVLDNGAMLVNQRAATATCATTAGLVALSYSADRWGCDVNVTSGAGQLAVVTSTPTPPPGFQNSSTLVRNSGALLQPQCAWQEIPTDRVVQLQGQNVVFSGNVQALAGLAADNANAFNLVIITGTGTDQGMGALRSAVGMTASPAITPAWTGIATPVNQLFAGTTSWVRYSTNPAVIATTVTEAAVGVCFTPTAAGAGATDGLAFTGMQLEIVTPPGVAASAYENRPIEVDTAKSQRFYWQAKETATTASYTGYCVASGNAQVNVPLPVPMQATPLLAWTVGGYSVSLAGAAVAAATGGAGANLANAKQGFIDLTFSNACTAGGTVALAGTNTTGSFTVSADY